jgi:hypothetical protein
MGRALTGPITLQTEHYGSMFAGSAVLQTKSIRTALHVSVADPDVPPSEHYHDSVSAILDCKEHGFLTLICLFQIVILKLLIFF